jgi:polysaccharide biosynthesis/export protein
MPGPISRVPVTLIRRACCALLVVSIGTAVGVSAAAPVQLRTTTTPAPAAPPPPPPDDYVIGADDVLTIVFWRDKDMSSEVTVRPDGKITLPLINDVTALGLTPEELRQEINTAAAKYLEDPGASVVVKQINSRKVFITGEVGKPGPYPLTTPTTVMQLIAIAGGLSEYAAREEIVIMRTERGKPVIYRFNYPAVSKGKYQHQNIVLKPGDTVVIP